MFLFELKFSKEDAWKKYSKNKFFLVKSGLSNVLDLEISRIFESRDSKPDPSVCSVTNAHGTTSIRCQNTLGTLESVENDEILTWNFQIVIRYTLNHNKVLFRRVFP